MVVVETSSARRLKKPARVGGWKLKTENSKLLRQEQPVVPPHESHFKQVPLRTNVSAPHSGQGSPS